MIKSNNTIAIPPGATIKEQLEYREMRQKDFAIRMDLSEKHISRLINGLVELTQDVALRLESVLGIPASYWNNLESIYREKIKKIEQENDLEKEIEFLTLIPYNKMASLGWIDTTRNSIEKVQNLRKFFEIANLCILQIQKVPGIVYRRTKENERTDYILAAWAQKAKIEARKVKVDPINTKLLKQLIPVIKEMTNKDPEVFCEELKTIFAKCGIALIFLPHIGGSFMHGASFRDGKHIVMGLSVRGKDADKFWFSLFHEICHVINMHIDELDYNDNWENEANIYARDTLISIVEYSNFIKSNSFTRDNIIEFAESINIAPGIVVGRLQKEKYIPYNRCNELKVKYEIVC